MGISASRSSSSAIHDDVNYGHEKSPAIHDDVNYGDENAVYHTKITMFNSDGSQRRIGSTYSHTGSKGLNQDSAILFQGYGIENGAFCGIFDGHGKNGHIVSKMARNRVPSLLLSQINATLKISDKSGSTDQSGSSKTFLKWKEACITSFKEVDEEIKLVDTLDSSRSGSTAVVVVKLCEHLIVANLGDSRAVLGTRSKNGIKAIPLTTDHKPGVPSEAERIRKCNGRVHIQRVWLPYENSYGLAMSRSLGDFALKNHGLICIPDVSYRRLTPNDEFIVLASDGVWDVLDDDEVMGIASFYAHIEGASAKAVVDAAVNMWKYKFPKSKRDDCTAICLFLK